jgi:hypothetical protein
VENKHLWVPNPTTLIPRLVFFCRHCKQQGITNMLALPIAKVVRWCCSTSLSLPTEFTTSCCWHLHLASYKFSFCLWVGEYKWGMWDVGSACFSHLESQKNLIFHGVLLVLLSQTTHHLQGGRERERKSEDSYH